MEHGHHRGGWCGGELCVGSCYLHRLGHQQLLEARLVKLVKDRCFYPSNRSLLAMVQDVLALLPSAADLRPKTSILFDHLMAFAQAEAELLAALTLFFERVGLSSSDVGIKVSNRKVRPTCMSALFPCIILLLCLHHAKPDGCFPGRGGAKRLNLLALSC